MNCTDCYNNAFDFDTCFGKTACEDGFPSYEYLKKENEKLKEEAEKVKEAFSAIDKADYCDCGCLALPQWVWDFIEENKR